MTYIQQNYVLYTTSVSQLICANQKTNYFQTKAYSRLSGLLCNINALSLELQYIHLQIGQISYYVVYNSYAVKHTNHGIVL